TLNREHINYVGLIGTDTRDKLFLARLIRSQFPNIQFFTDDSDILYAHPDYAADLWGMLVFSTYPLASQSRTWTPFPPEPDRFKAPRRHPRNSPSKPAVSIRNETYVALHYATLQNLKLYSMVKDDEQPLQPLPDYYFPLRPEGPVVWITAVGNGGMWPVS